MATFQPFTGRDCKLKVGQTEFSDIVTSFSLTWTMDDIEVEALTTTWSDVGPAKGKLSITFANDIDDPAGLWNTLYAAAGTSIEFEITAGTVTQSGSVIAKRPDIMANPTEVAMCDIELPVTGPVVQGTVSAKPAAKATS